MVDILGRTGPNKFLDQEELEQREIKSAAIEGREPDFSVANLAPLLADENRVVGVAAIVDPNRIDVNRASIPDIDRAIELLQARRDELAGDPPPLDKNSISLSKDEAQKTIEFNEPPKVEEFEVGEVD